MAPKIEVIEPKLYTGAVADELVACIRDVLDDKDRCSLVLSGGSTPGAIYRMLSMPPRIEDIEWERIDLYWGDERYVPHDNVNSNFRMSNETLLSHLTKTKPKIYPVPTEYNDPKEAAAKYEEQIRASQNLKAGQQPVFDIVLLGIGEDGHTASLFPGNAALNSDPSKICVTAEHPDGSTRISLTQHALFNAKKVLFIVKGAAKAEIVKRVINGNDEPKDIPARYFLSAGEKVSFFLDSEAAKQLES